MQISQLQIENQCMSNYPIAVPSFSSQNSMSTLYLMPEQNAVHSVLIFLELTRIQNETFRKLHLSRLHRGHREGEAIDLSPLVKALVLLKCVSMHYLNA
jgi:hypothetical protein